MEIGKRTSAISSRHTFKPIAVWIGVASRHQSFGNLRVSFLKRFFLCLFLFFFTISGKIYAQSYCASASFSNSESDQEIVGVTIGTMSNPSSCNETAGTGSLPGRYSNYTGLAPISLPQTNNIPFSVTVDRCGPAYKSSFVTIWIDFNHNGSFEDTGERVYQSPIISMPSFTETNSFQIPETALLGSTRLRVIAARYINTAPCGEYDGKETEDYTINITAPLSCNGTPDPGNTNAAENLVCPNSTLDFSLSNMGGISGNGLTYQWYNNAGPIEGATSKTYQAIITAADNFYCKVTCAESGQTGQSVPFAVTTKTAIECYCTSLAAETYSVDILNVTAGTLNHSTLFNEEGGPGSKKGGYSNFTTNVPAPVFNQRATIPFSAYIESGFYTQTSAWIDYNQNGSFDDAGERIYQSTGLNFGSYTLTGAFTIPLTALTGPTRMRIITKYGMDVINSACDQYLEGETEDYLVNIAVPPVCSGSPIQANTVATQNDVCPDVSFTFSLSPSIATSGNTYQWYDREGAIIGATNETFTGTITEANSYYCEVTCPNSALTTPSVPVALNAAYQYCACELTFTNTGDERLANVTVGSLNNSSNCKQTGGPGSALGKYSDYTTLVAPPNLSILEPIPYSVTTETCQNYGTTATSIWIDYNHNGVFDAPSERAFNSTGYPFRPFYTESGTFVIPASALPGMTRMRIIAARDAPVPMTSACGTYSYGEAEEYFVNIIVPSCEGVPTAGATIVSQNDVCANTTVTLSLPSFPDKDPRYTFQWFKNGDVITDATDVTYTTAVTATDIFQCQITCSNSGLFSSSAPVTVNVTPVSLPATATSHTQNVATTPLVGIDCQYFAKVIPGEGFTDVTVKSWLETTPPFKYVPRHYEITPATNPNTATGMVTLYFTQADFDAYNSTIHQGFLPTGPDDVSGIANFQIVKFSGTSPTGLDYPGAPSFIPAAPNSWNSGGYTFIWNSTHSIWEVTFPVSGFSGFLAKSVEQSLPVTLVSFTGKAQETNNELIWKTSSEVNFSHFEIERSLNAKSFANIGKKGTSESGNYTFLDSDPPHGKAYYRLKMIDLDTKYSFSKIIAVENNAEKSIVGNFYPNPSTGKVYIDINAVKKATWKITTYDLTGKLRAHKTMSLKPGLNVITIDKLSPGLNILKFENGSTSEIRKVVKQ